MTLELPPDATTSIGSIYVANEPFILGAGESAESITAMLSLEDYHRQIMCSNSS